MTALGLLEIKERETARRVERLEKDISEQEENLTCLRTDLNYSKVLLEDLEKAIKLLTPQ